MVHLRQHRRAAAFQSVDQKDFPERLVAVHHPAEQAARQSLERRVIAGRIELHGDNVIPDVEQRIVLPTGMPDVERRRYNTLAVAGNQMELRIDLLNEALERKRAFEYR